MRVSRSSLFALFAVGLITLSGCIQLRPPMANLPFAVRSDQSGSLQIMFCSPTVVESITGSVRPEDGDWTRFLDLAGPATFQSGAVLELDDIGPDLNVVLNEPVALPSEVGLSITRTSGSSYYVGAALDEGMIGRDAWALSTEEVTGPNPCAAR